MPRATDIMPITGFTRSYQKVVRELKKHGRPKVLTIDGKPSVVILDAAAYERLMDALYMDREVLKGLADDRPMISVSEARARIAALAKAGWHKPTTRGAAHRAA